MRGVRVLGIIHAGPVIRFLIIAFAQWDELKTARHEDGRGVLIAVTIHVLLVLQPTVESERAAFLRILIEDLGITPENGDFEPVGDHFALVTDLDAAIVGDGKIDDRSPTIRES